MSKYKNVVFLKPYKKSLKVARGDARAKKAIDAFIAHKEKTPQGNMDGNDSALAGGDLNRVGARQYDIGRHWRLFYVFKNGKVYLFELSTHEDAGTGTPPKQGKQKAYAARIQNAMNSINEAVETVATALMEAMGGDLMDDDRSMTFEEWLAQ